MYGPEIIYDDRSLKNMRLLLMNHFL